MQTTIMGVGQPPSVKNADPAIWVRSRQFTGRIVVVANGRIFDAPVHVALSTREILDMPPLRLTTGGIEAEKASAPET